MNFVFDGEPGERLDIYLSRMLCETRARVQTLIAQGFVLHCGKAPAKNGVPLKNGDLIEVSQPEHEPMDALPQDLPLDIVYEDGSIIVVNKARGMVVHPAAGNRDNTLVNALLYHCKTLSGIGGEYFRPGIVHRLDKQTTGLLVAAKNDAAHVFLANQMKERRAKRKYAALLLGRLKEPLTVDAPIDRSRSDRKRMAISTGGRPAKTDFYPEEELRSATLTRCELHTGRTHQIRVHAASTGHPVIGDDVYGQKKSSGIMMLHAYSLEFIHPLTQETLSLRAQPPEDFLAELSKYGWSGKEFWF